MNPPLLPGPLFSRIKQDFTCLNCGQKVIGSGYTNHCPNCLFSQHVDVNPGDRAASCGGLMRPINVHKRHGRYRLEHRCLICGFLRMQSCSKEDDFEALLRIIAQKI